MNVTTKRYVQSSWRTTLQLLVVAAIVLGTLSCRTTSPATAAPAPGQQLRGVASWYGEEFAGRTTANGEIFDPRLLTAAHRTLPFGTVLEVTNTKTRQKVRVRVNDRGPFVGNRVIDLSYGAAQQIGLIEPGVGEVEMAIVTVGLGDREPPAPYVVSVAPSVPPAAAEPPEVAFPLPSVGSRTVEDEPVDVSVTEERGGVETRRRVAEDGRTIETVPVPGAAPIPSRPGETQAERVDREPQPPRAPQRAPRRGEFVVQVGAFSVEENALALQERLERIGQKSRVDKEDLFRVRIGPFKTRDEAVAVRSQLEAVGMSAIVVAE